MQFFSKFLSRKFLLAVAGNVIVILLPGVPAELKAKILVVVDGLYIVVEGLLDWKGAKANKVK